MRGRALGIVVALALLGTGFGSVAAAALVEPPKTELSMGELLVDEAGGHLFATAGDTVAVFDLAGRRVATIDEQPGATDLLLRGRTLYVLAAEARRINKVDADSLEVVGGWGLPGVVRSVQMAWTAGAIWVTYGEKYGDGLAKLDPVTGEVTLGLIGWVPTGSSLEATTSPARLYLLERDTSPSTVDVFDVSSGLPVLLREAPHGVGCGLGAEVALAPTGNALWTACPAPYAVNQWDRETFEAPTVTYPTASYSVAVTVSGDGQTLVGGTRSSTGPDIWVFDVGDPTPVLKAEVGPGLLIDGMVATTFDGSVIYAATDTGELRVVDRTTIHKRPTITVRPDPIPEGATASVELVGTGMAEVTAVHLGPDLSVPFTVTSDNSLTITVPPIPYGPTPIDLTNPWGTSIRSDLAWLYVLRAPYAPEAPEVEGAPAYSVSLDWEPPANDGGSSVTGYRVHAYADGTTAPVKQVTVPSSSTTVTGLVAERSYRFTVAAVNAVGVGSFSPPSTAVAAGPPDVVAPFATIAGAVDQQYRDLRGRPATSTERTPWVERIRTTQSTLADLVVAVRNGADHRTAVDPTARLYLAFFDRPADAGGLRHWVGRRRSGVSLVAIADQFVRSSEFRNTYAGLSERDFVELVYERVLGRAGDGGGIAYWTAQLERGSRTRASLTVGFTESGEYVRTTTSEVTASVLPTMLLGRAPSGADYAASVASLDSGAITATDLAATTLSSPAYKARFTS